MTPFAAAAREIVKTFDFSVGSCARGDVRWRHHGLGMIQAELADDLRVHVWHPILRTLSGWRVVHDHRFDLTSAVVVGRITDIPYVVFDEEPDRVLHAELVPCFEIVHAKEQKPGDPVRKACDLWAVADAGRMIGAGEVYTIERRQFHTTVASVVLAITVVHRDNFDDRPARVLGSGESGIVGPPWSLPTYDIVDVHRVLDEAASAVRQLREGAP